MIKPYKVVVYQVPTSRLVDYIGSLNEHHLMMAGIDGLSVSTTISSGKPEIHVVEADTPESAANQVTLKRKARFVNYHVVVSEYRNGREHHVWDTHIKFDV